MSFDFDRYLVMNTLVPDCQMDSSGQLELSAFHNMLIKKP